MREGWCTPWSDMKGYNPTCTRLLVQDTSYASTHAFQAVALEWTRVQGSDALPALAVCVCVRAVRLRVM